MLHDHEPGVRSLALRDGEHCEPMDGPGSRRQHPGLGWQRPVYRPGYRRVFGARCSRRTLQFRWTGLGDPENQPLPGQRGNKPFVDGFAPNTWQTLDGKITDPVNATGVIIAVMIAINGAGTMYIDDLWIR